MPTPLAELADASCVYDAGRVVALRGVSLRVAPGESLAVVGPSGSGKSTLLHLLGGLEAPSGGRVLFEGGEPGGARAWARLRARRIGFVFQAYHLLPTLTAWEYVQLPMLLRLGVGDGYELRGEPFVVTGVAAPGVVWNDRALFLPLAAMRALFDRPGQVTEFSPQVAQPQDPAFLAELERRLAARLPRLTFLESGEIAGQNDVMRTFRAFAGAVSWVAMAMALVIVPNTLLMSVTERTREIGILAAVGGSPGRILGTIVLQGLLLTAIGASAGVALGAFSLRVVLRHPTLGGLVEPGLHPEVVAETLIAALLVGAVGGLYPAWRAAHARPAASLRHG